MLPTVVRPRITRSLLFTLRNDQSLRIAFCRSPHVCRYRVSSLTPSALATAIAQTFLLGFSLLLLVSFSNCLSIVLCLAFNVTVFYFTDCHSTTKTIGCIAYCYSFTVWQCFP